MAAPTATARSLPTGIKLVEGYRRLITNALDVDANYWEHISAGVGAPGLDTGPMIDTTTMHSVRWRTMDFGALITLTEYTFKAAYDPIIYNEALNWLGVNTTITGSYKDGSTIAHYGGFRLIVYDDLKQNEMPMATVTVTPTNFDPVNHVEAGPTMTLVAGS